MNPELTFLHGGSLELTLTVLLNIISSSDWFGWRWTTEEVFGENSDRNAWGRIESRKGRAGEKKTSLVAGYSQGRAI